MPHQNAGKSAIFVPLGPFFSGFGGAPWFLPKLPFFLPNPRSITELQSYVGFFENSSVGPRYIYVSTGFRGTAGQKLGYKIPKKGAKNLPPKLFTLLLDSKFDVDLNVSINHDQIP